MVYSLTDGSTENTHGEQLLQGHGVGGRISCETMGEDHPADKVQSGEGAFSQHPARLTIWSVPNRNQISLRGFVSWGLSASTRIFARWVITSLT